MKDSRPNYIHKIIKRAIEELDKADGRISLSELSQRLNMSNNHFRRLFSEWVGISPKQYHQYLTLEYPRQLLKNHQYLWKTTHKIGLEGPCRLHDTVVTWEVLRPQELAKKKKKIFVSFSWIDSPFGEALIMTTKQGICGISFSSEIGKRNALADMKQRWPEAEFSKDTEVVLKTCFQVSRAPSKTKIHVIGTPFQIKVWEALMHIPFGHVSTYIAIAEAIGQPKATRAVGTAVGKNPIGWLIPCHRALRKSGELGGYHWGKQLKRKMLAFESAHRDTNL